MCPHFGLTQVQSDVGTAANKAKNVASDLSEVTGAQNLAKQPNFFKGEGEVNATNEIKNKVLTASSFASIG